MPKIYTNYFIKVISLTKTRPELELRATRSSNQKDPSVFVSHSNVCAEQLINFYQNNLSARYVRQLRSTKDSTNTFIMYNKKKRVTYTLYERGRKEKQKSEDTDSVYVCVCVVTASLHRNRFFSTSFLYNSNMKKKSSHAVRFRSAKAIIILRIITVIIAV